MLRIAPARAKLVVRVGAAWLVSAASVMTVLPLVVATGCKGPGSSRLEGRWRGIRAEGVSPAAQDAANAFASQTELRAHGNDLMLSTPGSKGHPMAYVVDEETSSTLVLHLAREGASSKETFTFGDEGKTMTWRMGRMGEGHAMTFKKIP